MNVPCESKPTEGPCSICGSTANLRPGQPEPESEKEPADWYASRLEWALEMPILCEWICHCCDRLLKTANRLESELSAVLTTLQQRHSAETRGPCSGAKSVDMSCCPVSDRQTGASPVQVDGPSLGPKDVLISIWTDQPSSPPSSQPPRSVSESVRERDKLARHDESESASERVAKDGGGEKGDGECVQPAGRLKRKLTTRLPCTGCSRTFSTASALARHRRRAHRGGANAGSRGAGQNRSGEGSADEVCGRAETSGVTEKSGGVMERLADAGKLTMGGGAESVAKHAEGPGSASAGPETSEIVHSRRLSLTAPHSSVTGVILHHDAALTSADSCAITSEVFESSSISISPGNVDLKIAAGKANPYTVSKESPWLLTDSSDVDLSAKQSCTDLLPRPIPTSYSPVPSAVLSASTGLDDGRALLTSHHSHPDPASECLGNADAILGHASFPTLTMELLPESEAVTSSTVTCANEELDIAPDKSELFISFDTDVELSCTAATNVEQKSYPTSDTSIKQKLVANTTDDCARSDRPRAKSQSSRKLAKETKPKTGVRGETEAVPLSSYVKKPASGARRPRLALYERDGQKWRCLECSALFTSRTGAHGHALTHSEPDGGRCPRCGKTYANAYALRRHRDGCISGQPPSCPICGKVVADAAYLAQHVLTHSANVPKKHQCDRCGLAFAVGARLRAHIAVEHSGETPYRCDTCRREFKLQAQLRRHRRSAHSEVPAVRCEVCGKGFNRADHLRAHMTVHSGARPFVCTQCGRGFTRADTLADHSRLHTGERPFKCAQCGEAFREHRGYKRHLKTKHEKTETGGGAVVTAS